ncbi:MAG TPA: DUF2868 domain-containing protein [Usitatibacter sp.]|nr:DUF2868 domain-containing protein [Usitatibacter sp.]
MKAVEEADKDGTLLPPADRAAAAREAMRATPGNEQALMAMRARTLLERIAARHPFVKDLLDLLGRSWTLTLALAIVGLAIGAGLSALDGTRRINILAFPLLGLIAWNLAVYVVLLAVRFRPATPRTSLLREAVASAGARVAASRIARAKAFNAPLAGALRTFAGEWRTAAAPLLLARASRAFHLAAAAVGMGLIAGLYLRGIVFDYQAGWESTFLDAPRARGLLAVLYGPASWLTGVPIPEAAQLEATRWRPDGGGGEPAARWIHLMAATAFIYVVAPRLLLTLASGLRALRLAHRIPVPASLAPYFRSTFAAVEGAVRPARALVAPYACELSPTALARLIAWIPSTVGGAPTIDARSSVPYGEEERHLAELRTSGEDTTIVVLPFSLATTPEDENHGVVIAAARDWLAQRPGAQLLVMIDEAPYAERLSDAPGRLEERRAVWRKFVEALGVKPHFASLAP